MGHIMASDDSIGCECAFRFVYYFSHGKTILEG